MTWTSMPLADINTALETHSSDSLCGGLIAWACDCVDSLFYLTDHDEAVFDSQPATYQGHRAPVINVAHVRWATSTAITALDLCAAALARIHAGALGRTFSGRFDDHEVGLRQLGPGGTYRSKRVLLPSEAVTWCDGVLGDPGYLLVLKARGPLVHGRHPRVLQMSTTGTPPRDDLSLDGPGQPSTPARNLVVDSRDVAAKHVDDFLSKTAAGVLF